MKDDDIKKLEKENKELSKKYSKKKLSGYKIIIGVCDIPVTLGST